MSVWKVLAVTTFLLGACTKGTEISKRSMVIKDDPGGSLRVRYDEITRLHHDTTISRVELVGFCYSSCTLFIGLHKACTYPETKFGFHGPSYSGQPMPPRAFEESSNNMARFYKGELKEWFLETARYKLIQAYTKTGDELIKAGHIKAC